jgi:hypothetical protein
MNDSNDSFRRDQLWETSFSTYYAAYFEEFAADALIRRWQLIDEITKVMVAVTATGSAVAGWTLWNQEYFRVAWALIAGFAAVLGIVHTTLAVPARLRDWGQIRGYFTRLRVDLETFRDRMALNPEFSPDAFSKELVELRRRYAEGAQQVKADLLRSEGLEVRAQELLNQSVADQIADDE